MSECVVRMEMPEHCGECNLYVNGWCYGLTPDSPQEKEWYSSHKERPPMCPIICSLPEGHGRLVDADYYAKTHAGGEMLKFAETIVPAEAERSET